MSKEIQSAHQPVFKLTDRKGSGKILLQFYHLVFAVIGKLVVSGNISVADITGITGNGSIGKQVKIRGGAIGITIGNCKAALRFPVVGKHVIHLCEEIGIARLLVQIIAGVRTFIVDIQLVGPVNTQGSDCLSVRKEENPQTGILPAEKFRIQ